MDFQKVLLYFALGITLLMIYEAWQKDYGPQPTVSEQTLTAKDALKDIPAAKAEAPADAPQARAQLGLDSGQRISVTTDLFEAEIDTVGGDLRYVALRQYPVSVDSPDEPFVLMTDEGGNSLFIAQAALLPSGDSAAPNHHARFTAEKAGYRMKEGEDTLRVPLTWRSEDGVEVTKVYTFHRDSYTIDVGFEVENGSANPWRGHVYRQFQRAEPEDDSGFLYTYTGGVIYSQEEKFEKIKFSEMREETLDRDIRSGWAAMIQHYFLGAWIPQPEETAAYYTKAPGDNRYVLGMVGPQLSVAAGEQASTDGKLYVGPKLQDKLEALAPGLDLTVDYGIFTVIAKPLFWLLKQVHNLVGNWGWAIIIITILIKAVFYKLSATSYKSMAQMRKMQPRLQQLKERYGDDRQAMGEAMMKIYREEKINPLGGCLPIVVQIPVFIALYWMLLEAVELRQAPFMGWIQDMSVADPYYVLPILMGVTMLIQHRLNPTPMDPIQAKVMMILPVMFTFFFLFFPAGLVLYWVVNNVLSITQQWYITRVVIKE